MTASRPVWYRAILTAFSTASAPELISRAFLSCVPGASSHSIRHTSRYGSYAATGKQAWISCSACSRIAATIASGVWPRLRTPMPPPKSMYSRPSTSVRCAPWALAAKIGAIDTPRAT